MESLLGAVGATADIAAIIGLGGLVWGLVASWFLWRARSRRHRFSRVYFPKNRQDFYDYYVRVVSKARSLVCITSDGFNMSNTESRSAAARMNEAQAAAIKRGAKVVRYQMTETMHINWLYQIALMRRKHGPSYRTYINPGFESIGHFAVIDPGARRAIVEFMLPNPGGLTQATTARDFGFIHGHQAKADVTKEAFDHIAGHAVSVEVTMDNYRAIAHDLFNQRLRKHFDPHGGFHLFDEEILRAIRAAPGRRPRFEDVRFDGWPEAVGGVRDLSSGAQVAAAALS